MPPLTPARINLAYQEGRRLFRSWSKTPTQVTVQGTWFDLSMSPGNPPAQYYFATPLSATALARSTDGGIDHGPSLGGTYQKYMTRFDVTASGGNGVGVYALHDYLAFYPGIAMDTGVQTLTTGITIPRYDAADGIQMMVVEQNPYAAAGSTFQITYTNQDGVAGRVTPVLACNSTLISGNIVTSQPTSAQKSGLYVPLQSGDYGVASVDSIEFFAPEVGLVAIVLVIPIAEFQVMETLTINSYEMQRDFAYMPIIKDDAYLNLSVMPLGSLVGATIIGNIETIWNDEA